MLSAYTENKKITEKSNNELDNKPDNKSDNKPDNNLILSAKPGEALVPQGLIPEQDILPNNTSIQEHPQLIADVSQEETIQQNTNIQKISNVNNSDRVKYDSTSKTFKIFNLDNGQHTNLSIHEIIKYFTNIFNKSDRFLHDIKINNANFIEKYIGDIDKSGYITFKDIDDSPFMSDLGLLIRLNEDLYLFERESLEKELGFTDKKEKNKLKAVFYKFVVSVIDHTLGLFSRLTDYIIDIDRRQRFKNNILLYSGKLTRRLAKYTEMQLKFILEKNKVINNNINTSNQLKRIINAKLDKYIKSVNNQNMIMREQRTVNNIIRQVGGMEMSHGNESPVHSSYDEKPLSDTSDMKEESPESEEQDFSAIYNM